MAQYGWVLVIERSDDFDEVLESLSSDKKMAFIKEYYIKRFLKIEKLFPEGVRFASQQQFTGTACIIGSEKKCIELKNLIEKTGLGKMVPNTDCFRGAVKPR